MLTKAYIPYRAYFSSPFARWQGVMAPENAIILGANTAQRWMSEKKLLIVEDKRVTVKHLQSALNGLGYEAKWIVDSGEEAIEKAE